MASPDFHRVSDPRVLRAIAHPTRERVLAELYAAGPMRAADIAEAIGIPANQASFHLRQLAKYGLVTEAPELARDGRDRVWRPVHERGLTLELEEAEEQPGGRVAVQVWRRQAAGATRDFVDAAYAARKEEGQHVMIASRALRLSEEEAKEVSLELTELIDRWIARTSSPEQAAPVDAEGRRTYHLLQILQPYPEPATGAEPDGEPRA
jgi:predicted ArsR family transcriptional regulator